MKCKKCLQTAEALNDWLLGMFSDYNLLVLQSSSNRDCNSPSRANVRLSPIAV